MFSPASFVAALLACAVVGRAQAVPEPLQPQKEDEWLQRLVGEWEAECEKFTKPGHSKVL